MLNKSWLVRLVLKMIPKSERYKRCIFVGKRLNTLQIRWATDYNSHPFETRKQGA